MGAVHGSELPMGFQSDTAALCPLVRIHPWGWVFLGSGLGMAPGWGAGASCVSVTEVVDMMQACSADGLLDFWMERCDGLEVT